MADQVPFEEVEWNNSGAPESRWEVDEQEDAPYEPGDEVHVYIVFAPDISIEEGTELIEREVLKGRTLNIQRKDTAGNAAAAIMTYEQQQRTAELSQIVSAEISEALEPHNSTQEEQEPKLPGMQEKAQTADISRAKQDTETTEGVTGEAAGRQAGVHTTAANLGRGIIIIAAVLVFLWTAYRRRTGKR